MTLNVLRNLVVTLKSDRQLQGQAHEGLRSREAREGVFRRRPASPGTRTDTPRRAPRRRAGGARHERRRAVPPAQGANQPNHRTRFRGDVPRGRWYPWHVSLRMRAHSTIVPGSPSRTVPKVPSAPDIRPTNLLGAAPQRDPGPGPGAAAATADVGGGAPDPRFKPRVASSADQQTRNARSRDRAISTGSRARWPQPRAAHRPPTCRPLVYRGRGG